MFQELLQKHLARGALGIKMISIDKGSIALASDLGIKRTENQDRVAVIKFRSSTDFYTLIAAVDGMGGMRDGEKAAEIAISTFFSTTLSSIHLGSERAITNATLAANDAVFAFANGKGGCTLSAILLCSEDENMTVNVGDSRIYAKSSVFDKVVRLSVDDSLAEAVGGSGTELIQFIGTGKGITPHVAPLKSEVSQVYLTTDGIHYIDPQVLSDIIENADKVTQIVERLIATARWCGGPDNASICAVDLELITFEEHGDDETTCHLTDPFNSFQFIFLPSPVNRNLLPDNVTGAESKNKITSLSASERLKTLNEEPEDTKEAASKGKPKRKKRRSKKKRVKSKSKEEMQIKMTICDDASDKN